MDEPILLNQRYQLTDCLGEGGMALVYSGIDLMLERQIAVKILRSDLACDQKFLERFRMEAKAAANLMHPNIITVYDFGTDDDRLFIVMEYMPGMDLKTLIKQRGRFSIEDGLYLIIQACAGIGYAHRAGLIHCDIKPQNLLVSPDQRLKVTDFGIARALSTINPDEHQHEVWGSPQYFSPEQAAGKAPSPASDVYSLGVVMYEMLTGQLPFISDSPTELARMHQSEEPIPPSLLNPAIPPQLEQIILKVLSKEPSLRYRTADQLGRILQNFASEQPDPSLILTQPIGVSEKTVISSAMDDPQRINIDWTTIGLGLLTILSVGGLIPLWLAVFFNLFS